MVVRMNRNLAPKGLPDNLADPVGDDFVHVHVELRAAARHPDMKRKHIAMIARQEFVANLDDELLTGLRETPTPRIALRRCLLDDGVGLDHLRRHQISADTEM